MIFLTSNKGIFERISKYYFQKFKEVGLLLKYTLPPPFETINDKIPYLFIHKLSTYTVNIFKCIRPITISIYLKGEYISHEIVLGVISYSIM